MDAFEFESMKTEKAKAMLRFNLLQVIWKTFRFVELCLVVLLLSWASARLPFAVRISAEYFRRLITVVVSPIFVFAVSNVIVFALLFKTGQNPPIDNAESDLYNEILNNSEAETEFDLEPENHHYRHEEKNIVYQDKQVIVEAKVEDSIQVLPDDESTKKLYRRTQSEKLKNEPPHTPSTKELRRSETEIRQKKKKTEKETVSVVDELSNEEFQKTIEAFIAKQICVQC